MGYFFTLLKLPFQYEPKSFSLLNCVYVPDFYLPTLNIFGEVKPSKSPFHSNPKNVSQWIVNHPHYQLKWYPFSASSNLAIFIDQPGNYPVYEIANDGSFVLNEYFDKISPLNEFITLANTTRFR
jgi:hypothetical protein